MSYYTLPMRFLIFILFPLTTAPEVRSLGFGTYVPTAQEEKQQREDAKRVVANGRRIVATLMLSSELIISDDSKVCAQTSHLLYYYTKTSQIHSLLTDTLKRPEDEDTQRASGSVSVSGPGEPQPPPDSHPHAGPSELTFPHATMSVPWARLRTALWVAGGVRGLPELEAAVEAEKNREKKAKKRRGKPQDQFQAWSEGKDSQSQEWDWVYTETNRPGRKRKRETGQPRRENTTTSPSPCLPPQMYALPYDTPPSSAQNSEKKRRVGCDIKKTETKKESEEETKKEKKVETKKQTKREREEAAAKKQWLDAYQKMGTEEKKQWCMECGFNCCASCTTLVACHNSCHKRIPSKWKQRKEGRAVHASAKIMHKAR